jgi:hypothetical protein
MDTKTQLGQFAKIIIVDEAAYTVRGLTFLEYTDLLSRVGFEAVKMYSTDMSYLICKHAIISWSGLYWEDNEPFEYSIDGIDELDAAIVARVARFVIEDMTHLTELEEEKFKGYIRFLYYLSDEKFGESRRNQFNCETCVQNGWYKKRSCTLPALQILIDQKMEKDRKKNEEISQSETLDRVAALKQKMKSRKKKFSSVEELEASKSVESGALSIRGMNYPECPVSWIDPWIKTLADGLYDCSKSNKQFYHGGTADQIYKIYKAQRVVGGEASKIEAEQMKKK